MTVTRKDRLTDAGRGGGVLIATKPDLLVKARPDLDTDSEIAWTQLQLPNCKTLLLAAFYRPPSTNIEYLQTLDTSLSQIDADKNIWIAGDFNLPDIDWTALSPTDPPFADSTIPIIPHTNRRQLHNTLIDIINTYSLSQTVLTPTRTQNKTRADGDSGPTTTSHILDLFLTNNTLNITNTEVIPGLSDHDIVLVDADLKPTRLQRKHRPIFLHSKADIDSIKQDLTNYSEDFFSTDPYSRPFLLNWENFKDTLHSVMNKHIPQKTPSSRYTLPWFTRDLRKQHRKKQRLYRCAKTYNTPENWTAFKNFQKTFSNNIKKAEREHISRYLADNVRNNTKHFYKFFKSRRQDTTAIPALKDHNNILKTDPEHKSEILNTHFQSVFTQEDNRTLDTEDALYPPIPPLDITTNGILNLLTKLDTNKSSGPDQIPSSILKSQAPILAPILQVIFTQSLTSSTLPKDWLCANITPLFKTGDRTDPSNYRPISLTSIISKTLEHIIHKHIMNHIDRHNILTDMQHGFRPRRSCETQLISTHHDISRLLDAKDITQIDAILLDFAKAFDKVPHKRLLHKLNYYGITGPTHHWITAFLTKRTQRVLLDGTSSTSITVSSGVPQGTVLGPLLFLLYINDLPLSTPNSTTRLFADDSILYRPIVTEDDCKLLQKDLDALEQWEYKWQMSFRPDKCKLLRFSRSHKQINYQYTLHNQHLTQTTQHKYLGVYLTNTLSFNTHIDYITNKANKTLGFLRRNLHNCTPDIKHVAYNTLVRPTLEYCTAVWDPYTKHNIDKLEQVNTRAARFITHNYTRTPGITSNLKKQIDMDLLQTRRQAHRLTIMYKITNNLIDIHKQEYLQAANTRITRNSHDLKYLTYHTSTDTYKHSFFPRTIREWNSLPQDVVHSKSLTSFSNNVNKHLKLSNP